MGSFLYNYKRNIKYFAIEAYKVKNGFCPVTVNDVLQFSKNSAY